MPNFTKVFVVDKKGKPCLPTTPPRARIFLRKGKAMLVSVVPFIIQLHRVIENPIGNFTVGVDDGAKKAGIAFVNEHTKEVVFGGEIKLRQDVVRKMTARAMYRRTRRSRNLRHRKARFLNRKQATPFPSVRQRKDSIIRVIKDISKYLNVKKVIVEEGMFDIASLAKGHKLQGKEYQKTDYEGKNNRAKVLWRDKRTCQYCGSKESPTVDHMLPRSRGGTDTLQNMCCACWSCNLKKGNQTPEEFGFPDMKLKSFKYPSYLMVGKTYLKEQLCSLGLSYEKTVGWLTAYNRQDLKLKKTHFRDAFICVTKEYKPEHNCKEMLIMPKRTKVWEDNPSKKVTEKEGFSHYDLIKAEHRTRGIVVGTIRSLKKSRITLRTFFSDNFPVSYTKSRVLQKFNGIQYV